MHTSYPVSLSNLGLAARAPMAQALVIQETLVATIEYTIAMVLEQQGRATRRHISHYPLTPLHCSDQAPRAPQALTGFEKL